MPAAFTAVHVEAKRSVTAILIAYAFRNTCIANKTYFYLQFTSRIYASSSLLGLVSSTMRCPPLAPLRAAYTFHSGFESSESARLAGDNAAPSVGCKSVDSESLR